MAVEGQRRSDDPLTDRIGGEQVAALYRQGLTGVIGAFAAAVVIGAALIALGTLTWLGAGVWTGALSVCVGFHCVLHVLRGRDRHAGVRWRIWGNLWALAAGLDGVWWGCATLFLVRGSLVGQQFLTMMVALTVATGAVVAFSSYLPAFWAIFFPISLAALVANLIDSDPLHRAATVLVLIFIVTIEALGRRASRSLADSLRMRFEKDALTESLRHQKEVAEEASLAKSRFLAAASHDLRQPVHALGLFVGALHEQPMNGKTRDLVGHIETLLESIDDLFTSLLDVSRLDAGIVEARVECFPIAGLLDRIRAELEPAAREKGLRLTFLPSSAIVASDSVLLERILRNLVTNAIRYTDRGRILVGCRRHRRLSLEVWDTGKGIAPAERERIFQEFYQIANPERDRGKGLGLGLAIVRRLCDLLDHPLSLDSTPGAGSVFRLSIPLAARASVVVPVAAPRVSDAVLPRRLILVVDDEVGVRTAMRSLLGAWGHEVMAVGSGAEALAALAAPGARRPDLVLCDFRLRGHENGLDAIARLKQACGDDLPAVLITGDTAADRLQAVRASGHLVLHKPVPNIRLRAAIDAATTRPTASQNDRSTIGRTIAPSPA